MKARKLLMIPGPIEFEPEVYQAMNVPTTSHVAPDFINSFGNSLEMMREVWQAPNSQPFIISGSGTLAMDLAGANLIEPGDNALVVSTGYFGNRFADLLGRYGANVEVLQADTGDIVPHDIIENKLKEKPFKLLCFTHVDTSTAVKNDPVILGELGKKYDTLTVLDGVCSVAGEEIKQEEWGIDVVLTASQKAIGVPPGLALLVASQKAMQAWSRRRTSVGNYYADWKNWLPIMEAYESRKPSYFGTPAVNLVQGLEASLGIILKEGVDNRFKRHEELSTLFREKIFAMGLSMIPGRRELFSNTLSAIYYPDHLEAGIFLSKMNEAGIIVAGGLLPGMNTQYFRVGHMGSVNKNDIISVTEAIKDIISN